MGVGLREPFFVPDPSFPAVRGAFFHRAGVAPSLGEAPAAPRRLKRLAEPEADSVSPKRRFRAKASEGSPTVEQVYQRLGAKIVTLFAVAM